MSDTDTDAVEQGWETLPAPLAEGRLNHAAAVYKNMLCVIGG
jgi:hypothetical protein